LNPVAWTATGLIDCSPTIAGAFSLDRGAALFLVLIYVILQGGRLISINLFTQLPAGSPVLMEGESATPSSARSGSTLGGGP